jgi:hypothetical protein
VSFRRDEPRPRPRGATRRRTFVGHLGRRELVEQRLVQRPVVVVAARRRRHCNDV